MHCCWTPNWWISVQLRELQIRSFIVFSPPPLFCAFCVFHNFSSCVCSALLLPAMVFTVVLGMYKGYTSEGWGERWQGLTWWHWFVRGKDGGDIDLLKTLICREIFFSCVKSFSGRYHPIPAHFHNPHIGPFHSSWNFALFTLESIVLTPAPSIIEIFNHHTYCTQSKVILVFNRISYRRLLASMEE